MNDVLVWRQLTKNAVLVLELLPNLSHEGKKKEREDTINFYTRLLST